MKLQELASANKTRTIERVLESYFGSQMAFERLNKKQTQQMLRRVRGLIESHRGTTQRHHSEKNPAYLKLVMMEQALSTRLAEMIPPPAPATTNKPVQPAIDPNKLKAAQDKLSRNQTLSADEQKLINAHAAAQQQMQENRLRRAYKTLKESEVQQAQVVLAAQDMVDSMQGMIEDATEMQYKELPALVDSIRNQVGTEQANQFNTDVTAALSSLVQALQGAKQQMDTALGVVTGQAQPAPALDAAMGGEPMPGAEPIPGEEPMPGEEPADVVPPEDDEEAPLAAGTLGRERR